MYCSDPSVAQATAAILNDMLSYESMEAGTYSLHQEFVLLVPSITRMVNKLQLLGKEKNITILLEDGLSLHLLGSCYAFIDEMKLEQVLRSLVTNSIRVTPRNGHIRVRIVRSREEHKETTIANRAIGGGDFKFSRLVSVIVEDSGAGLSSLAVDSMFGDFNQIDPDKLQGST